MSVFFHRWYLLSAPCGMETDSPPRLHHLFVKKSTRKPSLFSPAMRMCKLCLSSSTSTATNSRYKHAHTCAFIRSTTHPHRRGIQSTNVFPPRRLPSIPLGIMHVCMHELPCTHVETLITSTRVASDDTAARMRVEQNAGGQRDVLTAVASSRPQGCPGAAA